MGHNFFDHLPLRKLLVVFGDGQGVVFVLVDIYLDSVSGMVDVIWSVYWIVLSVDFVWMFICHLICESTSGFIFANFDDYDSQGWWRNHTNDDHDNRGLVSFLGIDLLNNNLWLTGFLDIYYFSFIFVVVTVGLFSFDPISFFTLFLQSLLFFSILGLGFFSLLLGFLSGVFNFLF